MKIRKCLSLVLAMLFTAFLFVGCSNKKLDGMYVADILGVEMWYEFSGDEVTVSMGGIGAVSGTYEINGDEITITYDDIGDTQTNSFERDGKDIIIEGLLFELDD